MRFIRFPEVLTAQIVVIEAREPLVQTHHLVHDLDLGLLAGGLTRLRRLRGLVAAVGVAVGERASRGADRAGGRRRRQLVRTCHRQRWVIAFKTKIQLTNTLPIILNCVIGIIN